MKTKTIFGMAICVICAAMISGCLGTYDASSPEETIPTQNIPPLRPGAEQYDGCWNRNSYIICDNEDATRKFIMDNEIPENLVHNYKESGIAHTTEKYVLCYTIPSESRRDTRFGIYDPETGISLPISEYAPESPVGKITRYETVKIY